MTHLSLFVNLGLPLLLSLLVLIFLFRSALRRSIREEHRLSLLEFSAKQLAQDLDAHKEKLRLLKEAKAQLELQWSHLPTRSAALDAGG